MSTLCPSTGLVDSTLTFCFTGGPITVVAVLVVPLVLQVALLGKVLEVLEA
jgi:hypothetical protein